MFQRGEGRHEIWKMVFKVEVGLVVMNCLRDGLRQDEREAAVVES